MVERRVLMVLQIKGKSFRWTDRTYIMGILNATPDSFSDGGNFNTIEKAVQRAKLMESAGADIIDIGGESTRPDHKSISAEEEMDRVIPIVRAVREKVQIPISIDTYKSETAEAAIEAGANIINDIWGAKKDPHIASIATKYNVPLILMHNRDNKRYESLIDEIITDLNVSIEIAKKAGVKDEQIILDPGIGFGKTLEHNFIVMNRLDEIKRILQYPLLLGASRKSFITQVLPLAPEDRDNATGATTCLGIVKGANIVRVHDVKRTVELAKMMDAMVKGGN